MKAWWKRKPLGSILSILNGYAFDAKAFSFETGTPLIRIRDMKNGITTQTNFDGPFDQRYIVKAGSFLIGMDGEFACFEWHGPDSLLNQRVCKLHSFAADIDPRFLFYGINKHLKEIEDNTTFTTVKHLSSKQIAKIDFAFPSLDDQRRIVSVLDKAFAGIATATANAQKNLTNARSLFQNYLDQVFDQPPNDWDERTIGNVAAIKGGKRVPKGYKLLNGSTPYPYISVADFNAQGSVDMGKIRYISEEIFGQIKRYIIRKDDLYVSIAGTVGKTGIVPPELDGASLTENACRLVFNKGVLNRFVYYFTLTSSFRDQAIEQTRTAAQPKLALSRLQQICLPIPPLDAQEKLIAKFGDLAEKVRQVEAIYEIKLAALTELKQSLLHKAFAGELT